jgi:hypothetical protein
MQRVLSLIFLGRFPGCQVGGNRSRHSEGSCLCVQMRQGLVNSLNTPLHVPQQFFLSSFGIQSEKGIAPDRFPFPCRR